MSIMQLFIEKTKLSTILFHIYLSLRALRILMGKERGEGLRINPNVISHVINYSR